MGKFLARLQYIGKDFCKSRTAVKWGLSLWNIWWVCIGVCRYRKTCFWAVSLACAPGSQGSRAEVWAKAAKAADRAGGEQRAPARALLGSRELSVVLPSAGSARGLGVARWGEGDVQIGWAATCFLDRYLFPYYMKETKKVMENFFTTGEYFYFTAKFQWVSCHIFLHF